MKIAICVSIFMLLFCTTLKSQAYIGLGTQESPYRITNINDFGQLALDVNGGTSYEGFYFELQDDIDVSAINDGSWTPIGSEELPFKGNFNGKGHTISRVDAVCDGAMVGLFGAIENAKIDSLNVENFTMHIIDICSVNDVGEFIGAIAGLSINSDISNCTASGDISKNSSVGGICGKAIDGTITSCVSIVNIYSLKAAGICGVAEETSISNCLNAGIINTTDESDSEAEPIATFSPNVLNCLNVSSIKISNNISFQNFKATNYNDNQMSVIPLEGEAGVQTSELVSGSFFNNPRIWTENVGLYPCPKGVENTNVALLAISPVRLVDDENSISILSNFTVSTDNSVAWSSMLDVVSINGTQATINVYDAADTIVAQRGDTYKKVLIYVSRLIATEGNPLTIDNLQDFVDFRNAVNDGTIYKGLDLSDSLDPPAYFELTSDIDISQAFEVFDEVNGDEGWDPITPGNFFGGFDGGNHTITGLYINRPTITGNAGLFGSIPAGSFISNLNLVGTMIQTESSNVGAICGDSQGSIISCSNSGTVMGSQNVGGICGKSRGYINHCVNSGTVEGNSYVGGISGVSYGDLLYCANTATVEGSTSAGGIAGSQQNLLGEGLMYNLNAGRVKGAQTTGGIAGSGNKIKYNINCGYVDSSIAEEPLGSISCGGSGSSMASSLLSCFYDKQMSVVGAYSDIDFEIYGVGRLTNELIGSALRTGETGAGWTDENWIFADSMYPLPSGIENTNTAILAATPIFLKNGETVDGLMSNIALGGTGISWEVTVTSGISDDVYIENDTVFVLNPNLDLQFSLSAELNNAAKDVAFRCMTTETEIPESPLTIDSLQDLMDFANVLNMGGEYKSTPIFNHGEGYSFVLTSDIDLTSVSWASIRNFSGNLNGQGHKITNLISTNGGQSLSGFFYSLTNATIDSLNFELVNLDEADRTTGSGVLASTASNSVISNCSVAGTFSGQNLKNVGGFVGRSDRVSFRNCVNALNINVENGINVGGISGAGNYGFYYGCVNIGSISATDSVAGILGSNTSDGGCTIYNCINIGSVDASSICAAGIISNSKIGEIMNCANYGCVQSAIASAGICFNPNATNLKNNISVGNIVVRYTIDEAILGGIIGIAGTGVIENNYYDKNIIFPILSKFSPILKKIVASGISEISTQLLLTSSSQLLPSSDWTFTENMYPIPNDIPQEYHNLATIPLLFGEYENLNNITNILGERNGLLWNFSDEGLVNFSTFPPTVSCVQQITSGTLTIADTSLANKFSMDDNYYKKYNASISKGLVDIKVEKPNSKICDGEQIQLICFPQSLTSYEWNIPNELSANVNNSVVNLTAVSDYTSDSTLYRVGLVAQVEGCESPSQAQFDLYVNAGTKVFSFDPVVVCRGNSVLVQPLQIETEAEFSYISEWIDNGSLISRDPECEIGPIYESKNLLFIVENQTTSCTDTINVPISVSDGIEMVALTETDVSVCPGTYMPEIKVKAYPATCEFLFANGSDNNSIISTYNIADSTLTISGLNILKSDSEGQQQIDDIFILEYEINGCGSTINGSISMEFPISIFELDTAVSQSQIVEYGTPINDIHIVSKYLSAEDILSNLSWIGTENSTTPPEGITVGSVGRDVVISGTPAIGKYFYRVASNLSVGCSDNTFEGFIASYASESNEIFARDSVICQNDSTELMFSVRPPDFEDVSYEYSYSWTNLETSEFEGSGQRIFVNPQETSTYSVEFNAKEMYGVIDAGDIITADYELIKKSEWLYASSEENKEAYGVILSVDQDSLLIGAVNSIDANWLFTGKDIPNLQNYASVDEAVRDMSGWSNSQKIKAYNEALASQETEDPMSLIYDMFDDNWYLPSIGELYNYLKPNFYEIVNMAGGSMNEDFNYALSSTEKNDSLVYAIDNNRGLVVEFAKNSIKVPLVYAFKKISKNDIESISNRTIETYSFVEYTLNVNPLVDISITSDVELCNTPTAVVTTSSVQGGIYSLYNNNDLQTVISNTAVNSLTEGAYTMVCTDADNVCSDTIGFEIKNLFFEIAQDTVVCDSLLLSVDKDNVSYLWSNGYTTSSILVTETGSYSLTITDDETGCTQSNIANVTVNNSYNINYYDTICEGDPYIIQGVEQTNLPQGLNFIQTENLVSVSGCDSLINIYVFVENCTGELTISGFVNDAVTNTPIEGANISFDTIFVVTDLTGFYSIDVFQRNNALRATAVGYNSDFVQAEFVNDTTINFNLYAPELSLDPEPAIPSTYPQVTVENTISIVNTGNGPLTWSSVINTGNIELIPNEESQTRSNTSTPWNVNSYISTNNIAEQAVATDGYYIYTASWTRAGEINKYSLNGYVETFNIEGLGRVRNLAYNGSYFYATDATNKIYCIDMNSQTLIKDFTTQVESIRHCSYDKNDATLYVGDWNNIYKIDTLGNTLYTITSDLVNVYGSAYDNLTPGGPYLWLFSQISQNNGPATLIQQFDLSTAQLTGKTHYLSDIENVQNTYRAGGLCISENLYGDKYVILANVQHVSSNNQIVLYEMAKKKSWITTDRKSGVLQQDESVVIKVSMKPDAVGEFDASINFNPSILSPEIQNVSYNISVLPPECNAVENLVVETDSFSSILLSWEPVDYENYDSVAYIIYDASTDSPLDTITNTNYQISTTDTGNYCYYVRALSYSEFNCLSSQSNSVCAEIISFPCDNFIFIESFVIGDDINVVWTAPYGAEEFALYRNDLLIEEAITDTLYLDTNVEINTQYCYYVVAKFANDACDLLNSPSSCSEKQEDLCSVLPQLSTETIDNTVMLTWVPIESVVYYNIYRNDNLLLNTIDTVAYDMALGYNETYCYYVEAVCNYGSRSRSDSVCVNIVEENSVYDMYYNSINLYPNPAIDVLFVEGENIIKVEIINTLGQIKEVIEDNLGNTVKIYTEDLEPGIYGVKIALNNGFTIIKQAVITK